MNYRIIVASFPNVAIGNPKTDISMIRSRIQIEDGEIKDMYDEYNFVYVSSDNTMGAPMKPFDSTSYAEEPGEHIDPRTVPSTFEYKAKFVVLPNRPDFSNYLRPNLLLGTSKGIDNWYFIVFGSQAFNISQEEANILSITRTNYEQDTQYESVSFDFDPSTIKKGVKYALSVDVYQGTDESNPESNSRINITTVVSKNNNQNHLTNSVTKQSVLNKWTRLTFELDGIEDGAENGEQVVIFQIKPIKTFYNLKFKNIKLETGSDSTPYTKAKNEYPTVNSLVAKYNNDIRVIDGNGLFKSKTISFFNDYKFVKIVGIPKPIESPDTLSRRMRMETADHAEVELVIEVKNPLLCDFDTFSPKESEIMTLELNGKDDKFITL